MLRHITFRQLKAFEAVASLGSFTAAAEALHLAQPTLSIQVRKLTDAVGAPLFEQVGKRIFVTAVGREVLKTTHQIFLSMGQLRMSLDNLQGIIQGTLQISAVTTAEYFAPRMLGEFRARYPGVSVSLQIGHRDRVIERMQQNLDDLYILGHAPLELEVEPIVFMDNPLIVVAAANHPLAGQHHIPSTALANETFIMREQGSDTRLAIERYLAAQNIQPRIGMELVGSNEAIKQAVIGGLGIAVMSRFALAYEIALGHVTILDVEGFPINLDWQIMYPKGKQLSAVARRFCDFMVAECREIFSKDIRIPK
ncbi:MAG: LysR family transcriptional regulator [Gammaproteobacteria bacterium]|nr:LysR family transcriptional regulator [Gammaproteobacteria bacterium]